jgi:bacterial/archaeal transporter family protein
VPQADVDWLPYTLISVVLWAIWATLAKVALRDLDWAATSFLYGAVLTVSFGLVALVRHSSWDGHGTWVGALSGAAGAAGLLTLYLALGRAQASVVIPVVGMYPIVTVAISVLFLGEHLNAVQVVGICVTIAGVVLVVTSS